MQILNSIPNWFCFNKFCRQLSLLTLFLGFLAGASMAAFCQDLVVTKKGDTLNCRITKNKSTEIHFTYQYNGEVRESILPKSHIAAYQLGYYTQDSNLFNNLSKPRSNVTTPVAASPVVALKPKISTTGLYDLIVDKWGDSMVCKILEARKDKIRFRFGNKDNPMITEIPMSNVSAYYRNFFEKPTRDVIQKDLFSSNSALEQANAGRMNPVRNSTTRIALSLGVGHRIASSPGQASESYKDHIRGLRTGFLFGADIGSFTSETFGWGAKFTFHQSSQNSPSVSATGFSGSISENIRTTFIGPVLHSRMISDGGRDQVVLSYGLGYLGYSNNAQLSSTALNLKGATIGLTLDLAYEVPMDELGNMVAFQVGILLGNLNNIKVNGSHSTQSMDQPEGLSRLDFTIGLRFGH